MVGPLNLPVEIFQLIVSFTARKDLSSFALVSKPWCAYVVPVLYNTIDLTWRRPILICDEAGANMHLDRCLCEQLGHCKPDQHDGSNAPEEWWARRHVSRSYCLKQLPCVDEKWPSLYLLAKTLVSSPDLARLTALSHEDIARMRPKLRHDAHMSQEGWLHRLDHGCPDAFAALALTCLTGIQTFHLAPSFEDALAILGIPLLRQILPHVTRARVGTFDETVIMGSGRPPHVQADSFPQLFLLHLPSVRSLSLNLPRPLTPFSWPDATPTSLTTGLKSLELSFTFLEETDLARLLRSCPSLRTFKYDYWTTPPTRDPHARGAALYIPERSSERLRCLNIVQRTLETFHLHIVRPQDWFNQNILSIDFSGFYMLTTLHVPFQLLADKLSGRTLAQSVPPSLKHLWLNDDSTFLWLNHNYFQSPQEYYVEGTVSVVYDPSWHPIRTDQEMMDVITDFPTHWRSHMPYLQTIKLLLYPVSVPAWGPRDISAIRMALDSAGQESGVDVSYMNARVVVRVITHSLVKIHRTSNSTEYRRVHGLRCITGDKLSTQTPGSNSMSVVLPSRPLPSPRRPKPSSLCSPSESHETRYKVDLKNAIQI
ncbi:hypothetical protein E4T43_06433 [Aureobasidium subglaciale]|nr:hypothetical protein E4T43_06433 [Aureobasidium subglaciale]